MTTRGLLLLLPASIAIACASSGGPAPPSSDTMAPPGPPVVELRITDYAFHAPSQLRSGWNTLRTVNEGKEAHFVSFWRLPEGKIFDDYVHDVYEPFMALFIPYKQGQITRDALLEGLGSAFPDWVDLRKLGAGGSGLLSPGYHGITTLHLEPGKYVMECYMVTSEGKPHNSLGMLRPLVVTADGTGASAPQADVELTLRNDGISVAGDLSRGQHTIRVAVAEDPPGFLGHDVNLARLDEDTEIDDVVAWMSWIDGMTPPAPAVFLGGADQVPAGQASYFTIDLGPGRYAWISEGYAAQGVLAEFRVE